MYIQWFGRDALTKEKPEKPLEFYIYIYILAEPVGLAPHSNVYLSVPGGGCSFLTKLFFPLMGGGRGLV